MPDILLKNARMVNEGRISTGDLRIAGDRIAQIGFGLSPRENDTVYDCGGLLLLPGLIDDQVHFREPGLTHKARIYTESKAALAGGVTSYMEMPNTKPSTTNAAELDWKRARAAETSWVNYAFFFGASNENLEEVLRVDPLKTCGIKIFMGSSTGNMLVDEPQVLEKIFASTPLVIATHCEDEATIRKATEAAIARYGDDIPFDQHPVIRSREACYLSSSMAIGLARKHGANLHVLHLTTADELPQFDPGPMDGKKITAEVCVHHLRYAFPDYARLGREIKCNPAVKDEADREALWQALNEGRIDIVATDHAPHTREEKQQAYLACPSGLPLVQHSLNLMLDAASKGKISLERLVQTMCHNPATRFSVKDRGFLREGYFADLVLADPEKILAVSQTDLLYHCAWSPLEGESLKGRVVRTFVNGQCLYEEGVVLAEKPTGKALEFDRS